MNCLSIRTHGIRCEDRFPATGERCIACRHEDLLIARGVEIARLVAAEAEVRRLREREAALEKVVALAECGPPMHRFPVAPPIIGFTDNEGPIYPPGYDPTKHADDCTGCKFNAARAALAALDAKEKPHD